MVILIHKDPYPILIPFEVFKQGKSEDSHIQFDQTPHEIQSRSDYINQSGVQALI